MTLLTLRQYIIDSDIAEATVALRTFVFARELGLDKVELEGNALLALERKEIICAYMTNL